MESKKNKISSKIILLTIFYSMIYVVGFNIFLSSAGLLATGITGATQIIYDILANNNIFITFGILYIILNIPGFIISVAKLGKKFSVYSLVSIITIAVCTTIMPSIQVTDDLILNAIFGGIIIGFASGKILRIGSSSGGFEPYGLYFYQKFGIEFTKFNLIANSTIVLIASLMYGLEIGLYTLLFVYIRNLTVSNFFTKYEKLSVWIISDELSEISDYINEELGRGTTIFKSVEGGYSSKEKEVVFTVVSQYEYLNLIEKVESIDPDAFISTNESYDISGNYKRITNIE